MSQKKDKVKEQPKKSNGLTQKQRSWIYTGLFLVAAVIFFIINNSEDENVEGPYPPGYNPNPVKTLSLTDLKGKTVLIDFWATWCPPCRKGIPDLIQLKKEFKDKNFEILGISLDAITRGGKTENDVLPYMKEKGINYPVLKGLTKTMDDFGGIQSIPTSFLIDKNGKIVKQYEGLVEYNEYKKTISATLTGNKKGEKQAPNFELIVIE